MQQDEVTIIQKAELWLQLRTTVAALKNHRSRDITFFEYLWWLLYSGKGKVVPVLEHHVMKMYGGVKT
jgi:hypothetical protein